jgi:hypothetical protein
VTEPIGNGLPCPSLIYGRFCNGATGPCWCDPDPNGGPQDLWRCADDGQPHGGMGGTDASSGSGGHGQAGEQPGPQAGEAGTGEGGLSGSGGR